jgi:alcohol dehydrogenase class IV
MNPFDSNSIPRIEFGRGKFSAIGPLTKNLLSKKLGSTALVIHNGKEGETLDRLRSSLADAGVRYAFVRQRGEPQVSHIDAAVAIGRDAKCDVLIGLGGGSAIDAAKAVAGLLTNGGVATDFMEVVGKGQKITQAAMPWIAVPTTAGTGAEATKNAVVGLPEKQFKASIRSELLLPRVALVDPELGLDVPPDVTARSGMDALCQCIESYTSNNAGPETDPFALQGIGLAATALPHAFEDGHDIDARSDMALAALLSGITLTRAGLGAVHGFAAPLGAMLPIPHGTICAALPGARRQHRRPACRVERPSHARPL